MSPKPTGDRCLCRTCGQYFNSTGMFDRHRLGRHDLFAPHFGRRCLTVTEMRERGYVVGAKGFWIRCASWHVTRRNDDALARYMGKGPTTRSADTATCPFLRQRKPHVASNPRRVREMLVSGTERGQPVFTDLPEQALRFETQTDARLTRQQLDWYAARISSTTKRPRPPQKPPDKRPTLGGPELGAAV